jgi:type III secretory pathway component EscV
MAYAGRLTKASKGTRSDLLVAVGVIAVVMMMIIPLPAFAHCF